MAIVVEGSATTTSGSFTGSPIVVNLPASIAAGEILVVIFLPGSINPDDGDYTTPSGWTKQESTFISGYGRLTIYTKIATGSEGSTVSITVPYASRNSAISLRISGGGTIYSSSTNGAGNNPNPPSLSPAGGSADYLWLAIGGLQLDNSMSSWTTAAPTNYTAIANSIESTNQSSATIVAKRTLTASTEDPGAFANNGTASKWYGVTLAIAPGAVSVTVTADATKNVTFTKQDPTVTAQRYVTIAADTTKNITFTAQSATVTAETTTLITVDAVKNITFTGYAPTIDTFLTRVTPSNVPAVAFEKLDPGLAISTTISETSFNGDLKSWHSTPYNIAASGTSYTVDNFQAYNASSSTGLRYNRVIITTPSSGSDFTVTINWEYRKYGGESNNRFSIWWQGVEQSAYTGVGDGTTATVTGTQIVKTGLSAATTYTIDVYLNTNTNVYPFAERATVTSLGLSYLSDITIIAPIVVGNAPAITFTPKDPVILAGVSNIVTISNVPASTWTPYDANVSTPGTVSIGTTVPSITTIGYAPTVTTVRNINQIVTNDARIEHSVYNPTVRTVADILTFKFIDSDDVNFTAGEAELLTSVDLGAALYNQDKRFSFRLGNTSNSACNFTISANSVNNLSDMVSFSLDRVNYSSTLDISLVPSNGVTDAIWVKLAVTTEAYTSSGTFKINVEQTNA